MSIGEIFGVVGGSCCSDMNFSNFRKPFNKISSFSSVWPPWPGNRQGLVPMLQSGVHRSWEHAAVQDSWLREGLRGDFGWRNLVEQVWARVGPGSCLG